MSNTERLKKTYKWYACVADIFGLVKIIDIPTEELVGSIDDHANEPEFWTGDALDIIWRCQVMAGEMDTNAMLVLAKLDKETYEAIVELCNEDNNHELATRYVYDHAVALKLEESKDDLWEMLNGPEVKAAQKFYKAMNSEKGEEDADIQTESV